MSFFRAAWACLQLPLLFVPQCGCCFVLKSDNSPSRPSFFASKPATPLPRGPPSTSRHIFPCSGRNSLFLPSRSFLTSTTPSPYFKIVVCPIFLFLAPFLLGHFRNSLSPVRHTSLAVLSAQPAKNASFFGIFPLTAHRAIFPSGEYFLGKVFFFPTLKHY